MNGFNTENLVIRSEKAHGSTPSYYSIHYYFNLQKIDPFMLFIITLIPGNCGTLLISHVSSSIISLSNKIILNIFLYLLENCDTLLPDFGKKNLLLFTDKEGGMIDNLFNRFYPKRTFSKELIIGQNKNTSHNLLVRTLSDEQIRNLIKNEKESTI